MTKRQSISPAETKRYLDHASEAQGGNTAADLADLLDVYPPRISEGRRRKWCMTEAHKEVIIEHFGAPQGSPGTFVQAETHDSLASFLEGEEPFSRRRHLVHLARIVNAPSFKNELAQSIEWADERMLKADGEGRPDTSEYRAERLERLDALMALPEFEVWLEGASEYLGRLRAEHKDPERISACIRMTSHFNVSCIKDMPTSGNPENIPSNNSLDAFAETLGIRLGYWSVFPALYVLGQLRYDTESLRQAVELPDMPSYSLQNGLRLPPLHTVEDYVITGSCVFDHNALFSTPKIGKPCLNSIFLPDWRDQPHRTYGLTIERHDQYTQDKEASSLSVDYWVSYTISVYLKDSCDYAVHLSLSDVDHTGLNRIDFLPLGRRRDIVIPEIAAVDVFKVLEELRKWLEMPELPLLEIKSQIAQQGGYIPGARVI